MTEPIDVDASWDGTGSLDEHRTKMFKTITEQGFGAQAKPAEPAKTEPAAVTPEPEPTEDEE